jgi:threonine dehydrogenase-like Zn-dependent dehydrogenase
VGSRCGPFHEAVRLLRTEQVKVGPLITKTFSLRDAAAAMRFAEKSGVMKVLLKA